MIDKNTSLPKPNTEVIIRLRDGVITGAIYDYSKFYSIGVCMDSLETGVQLWDDVHAWTHIDPAWRHKQYDDSQNNGKK